jgi:hypothetical protein
MPDQPSAPAGNPSAPKPTPPSSPTINIGEEYGTAKKNLPPGRIVAIAIVLLAVVVFCLSYLRRAKPSASGALDNIVAVEVPGQTTTMVAVTFTLNNTSDKIFYVRSIQSSIKTPSGDATSDALSVVDYDRYFQIFPALKAGAQPPLPPDSKLQPGEVTSRTMLVAFPKTLEQFNQRQSFSLTVWPYEEPVPIVMTK